MLLIFGLSLSQSNGQSIPVGNSATNGANSGTNSGNSGNTGTKTGDGTRGYNQGYSYNTGIQPYQTGFTFYQPFGDAANAQNTAGGESGQKSPTAQPVAPVAQPVAPVGYQPGYNVFSAPQSGNIGPQTGQPIQYQNVPQFVHFGPPPTQGAQPIPVQPIPIQPIALPNFEAGLPNLDSFGLGGTQPNRRNNNNNNNNGIPNLGNDFGSGDFGIPGLSGGGGGGNANNNGFFSQPNNNNNNDFGFPSASNDGGGGGGGGGYDSLPDDSSLANFANLGGGGQSNDYPDNDFGGLGDFGSATQNRGTFDILPNFNNGFFRRK